MKRLITYGLSLLIALACGTSSFAQTTKPAERYDKQETRILFIVDASFSMYGLMGSTTKMQAARKIMKNVAARIDEEDRVMMALRVFGHQSAQKFNDCTDSRLEVGFRINNGPKLNEAITAIQPNGITPIAYSLGKAARDFASSNARNIIVLVTDGFESCEENACEVSLELQRKGITITPYIVGLMVDESRKDELTCIGNYFDVYNEQEMAQTMDKILDRIINTTVTRVNLLDHQKQSTETDAMMTFYNSTSGKVEYNYYHTINNRGESDSLFLEPSNTYDLVIHSNPPIERKQVGIESDLVNNIDVDAAQGYLRVAFQKDVAAYTPPYLIRQKGGSKTMMTSNLNEKVKLLDGPYTLEILTLPRISLSDVDIKSNENTEITIPTPGLVHFKRSQAIFGTIVRDVDGKTEEVYTLNSSILNESLNLQPGNYRVIYRAKIKRKMTDTRVENFVVSPGSNTTINFNFR